MRGQEWQLHLRLLQLHTHSQYTILPIGIQYRFLTEYGLPAGDR
jgi:hypothetical protein